MMWPSATRSTKRNHNFIGRRRIRYVKLMGQVMCAKPGVVLVHHRDGNGRTRTRTFIGETQERFTLHRDSILIAETQRMNNA